MRGRRLVSQRAPEVHAERYDGARFRSCKSYIYLSIIGYARDTSALWRQAAPQQWGALALTAAPHTVPRHHPKPHPTHRHYHHRHREVHHQGSVTTHIRHWHTEQNTKTAVPQLPDEEALALSHQRMQGPTISAVDSQEEVRFQMYRVGLPNGRQFNDKDRSGRHRRRHRRRSQRLVERGGAGRE